MESRRVLQQTIMADRGHGKKDTILEDFEPENLIPVVHRAEEILRPGQVHSVDDFRNLWLGGFRSHLISAPKLRGDRPIVVNERQMELLIILASVVGADLLTSQIEVSEVRGMVLGSFQELQYRYHRDDLYSLPYQGDSKVVFYRKALRVVLSLYGNIESLDPVITTGLPSQLINARPSDVIDGLFGSLHIHWTHMSELLAHEMMDITVQYGQVLRILEHSDNDYISPDIPDNE